MHQTTLPVMSAYTDRDMRVRCSCGWVSDEDAATITQAMRMAERHKDEVVKQD